MHTIRRHYALICMLSVIMRPYLKLMSSQCTYYVYCVYRQRDLDLRPADLGLNHLHQPDIMIMIITHMLVATVTVLMTVHGVHHIVVVMTMAFDLMHVVMNIRRCSR